MTDRLRALMSGVAAQGYCGDWHQKLFYALSADLLDLAVLRSTARGSVPVREIMVLHREYVMAEEKLMREWLKGDK
jgi:hypothetical protein